MKCQKELLQFLTGQSDDSIFFLCTSSKPKKLQSRKSQNMISNKLMIARADQLLYSDRLATYNEYMLEKQK